jgi:hypothetical protein
MLLRVAWGRRLGENRPSGGEGAMDWRLLGVFAVGAAWAASAEAQVSQQVTQIAPFTARCTEAEATGFNWEKGKWLRVNFTPTTLLVHKFDPARHAGEPSVCDSLKPDDPLVLDDFATMPGCFSAGDTNDTPLFDWCDEFYDKVDGQWRLDSIDCPWIGRHLAFKPDGAFVFSMTGADLSDKPEGDQKDSLKVSHGRCRPVNRP